MKADVRVRLSSPRVTYGWRWDWQNGQRSLELMSTIGHKMRRAGIYSIGATIELSPIFAVFVDDDINNLSRFKDGKKSIHRGTFMGYPVIVLATKEQTNAQPA